MNYRQQAAGHQQKSSRRTGTIRFGRTAYSLAAGLAVVLSACTPSDGGNSDPEIQGAASDASHGTTDAGAGVRDGATGPPPATTDTTASTGTSPAGTGGAARDSGDLNTSPPEGSEPAEDKTAATSAEGTLTPPAFSPIDSVLTEDAFDGPDLQVASVDVTHEDVHQVVFSVEGRGFPGWEVAYLDDGPAASSALGVTLIGVDASAPLGLPESEALQVAAAGSDDGDLSMVLHLDQEAKPFRVYLRHSPMRVVVEVTM